MTIHELKTWPGPFTSVAYGTKRHEIRKDDRAFGVGDILLLREWDPGCAALAADPQAGYTGRSVVTTVTHKTPGGNWGLPDDVCVMSLGAVMSVGNLPEDIRTALAAREQVAPVDEASR